MIIFQLFLGLIGATLVGAFLRTAERGRPRVSVLTLALLCLAWIPVSGLLWVGWGKLTGLNAHFGVGDSTSTSLRDGYSLIITAEVDGLLCGGPESEQLVSGIDTIAETSTHYYGLTTGRALALRREFGSARSASDVLAPGDASLETGAFAVRKETGSVRYAANLPALGDESLDPGELVPVEQFPGRPGTVLDDVVFVLLFLGPFVLAWRWLRSRSGDTVVSEYSARPTDFEPDDLCYPLKLEWSEGEVRSYRGIYDFGSDVEYLNGMKDDPSFKLSDASGRRLYVLMEGCAILRASFVPDGGR